VIIADPTHYAVALKYESGKMAAPVRAAKGAAAALKIREGAAEHEVPVVETPPLIIGYVPPLAEQKKFWN
jgi:flagellar biosynthesis protein FlhB